MSTPNLVDVATIPKNEVASRRQVGRINGKPVWAISGIGGIHTIFDAAGKPLGAGNHPGLARYTAMKSCPGIEFDDLEKSEHVPFAAIADLVPAAMEMTRQIQAHYEESRRK